MQAKQIGTHYVFVFEKEELEKLMSCMGVMTMDIIEEAMKKHLSDSKHTPMNAIHMNNAFFFKMYNLIGSSYTKDGDAS